MSWSERPKSEATAAAAADDEGEEKSEWRSWKSGGSGGAAATEDERRREDRKRRRRWMEADATKTKATMAEMMKRLGLRDIAAELVAPPEASAVGGKFLRGRSEGGAAILVKAKEM